MPAIQSYDDFIKVHGVLLAASGIPQKLHPLLFQKLAAETFDGGHHFQIEPVEDGKQRRLLFTSEFMAKESNLFLVDHAWTFRLSDAYKQVRLYCLVSEEFIKIVIIHWTPIFFLVAILVFMF